MKLLVVQPAKGPNQKLARLVGASAISEFAQAAHLPAGFRAPASEDDQRSAIGGRVAVLMGVKVARAFGLGELAYLEWRRHCGGRVVVLPLPTATQWWARASNVSAAREVLVTAMALGRQ